MIERDQGEKGLGSIFIGQLQVQDAEPMGRLWAQEFPDFFTPETAQDHILEHLERYPELCFVAMDDEGNPRGFAVSKRESMQPEGTLYLDAILVEEEYRKNGTGQKLIRATIEKARDLGYKDMLLLTDSNTGFPMEWYMSLGLELTGWVELGADLDDVEV